MAESKSQGKLRIAISGGGLAGASLANALFCHPHLEVHVYESAPEFSERGAAVGLAINAQRALDAIVPSAKEFLDRAGAVLMNSSRLMTGSGPKANTMILDLAGVDPGLVVHRAALLRELLAPIPAELLHPNKKLTSMEEDANGLTLRFQDGTVDHADALIGADGIFGFVREYLLGDDPSSKPVAAGWWDCRNLLPFEKVKEKLGADLFKDPRQYGWVGDRGFIMHDILDDGKMVQCVGCCVETDATPERKRPLDRESLEKYFASWLDGPIAKNMIDLLLDQENPSGYSQWEHKNAHTYAKGRVCLAGDAAHAMTPWQGSGAAQAIEDAAVLGALLSKVTSPEQIAAAFKAYDEVRRPRSQRIVESSSGTGRIMTGLEKEIGTDPEKIGAALAPRWNFIYGFDIGKHQEEAVEAFTSSVQTPA